MARETWAVYSVRDHTVPYAFVTDVLLYDRVRVPTPSPDDLSRWQDQNWQPERQAALVEKLGDRARPLVWDEAQREAWSQSYEAAKRSSSETELDAFQMTRTQLIDSLPRSVTGIDTVASYRDLNALRDDTGFEHLEVAQVTPGLASAVIAAEFAVPAELDTEPESLDQELEVLGAALEISSTKQYQRYRRAYWRWLRELSAGVVADIEAVEDAADELRDLTDEQRDLVREARADTAMRTGFLAAEVTLGLVAAAINPVALAGAAIAIGHFTWSELRSRRDSPQGDTAKVTAMYCQIEDRIRREYFEDLA